MAYTWIHSFSDKELHGPFEIKKDSEYYPDLRKRLTHFVNVLKQAHADEESIQIANRYTKKICEAIREYLKGNVVKCHQIIENLIIGCDNHPLAVSELATSCAFPGTQGTEIQFFRARTSSEAKKFKKKDMLHLPFSLRGKSGNYRFSIPGVISLYLANSSYGCWIEMRKPSDHDFYVAPVILDGKQTIFNLAVMTRWCLPLNDGDEIYVHCWVKLLTFMIATSYIVEEENRTFCSEYIISQSIMLACKKRGYDGVAYFSKRADEELFSFAAINLALFADFDRRKEYGAICEHIKVDEPLNYQLFRQLTPSATYKKYNMRVRTTGLITNINGYKRQYTYDETEFYRFDEHLFARWDDKESIEFGNALK